MQYLFKNKGKVVGINGYKVIAKIKNVKIDEICNIIIDSSIIPAKVMSFHESMAELMLFEPTNKISLNDRVIATGSALRIPVGESLLGRQIDALGNFLDNKPVKKIKELPVDYYLNVPIEHKEVDTIFETGIKVIDCFNTIGHGQSMSVFYNSGAGVQTLSVMLFNFSKAINVFVCTVKNEEEKTEILSYLNNLDNSVIIWDYESDCLLKRTMTLKTAMLIAEDFRVLNKNVLLMFLNFRSILEALDKYNMLCGESLYSDEITLSFKQQFYTMYSRLGKVNYPKNNIDSTYNSAITTITFYNFEAGEIDLPMIKLLRSLEGHIYLSWDIAEQQIFPAIDILGSISRYQEALFDKKQMLLSKEAKRILAEYRENEYFINSNEYVIGINEYIDKVVRLKSLIESFRMQRTSDRFDLEESLQMLESLLHNNECSD